MRPELEGLEERALLTSLTQNVVSLTDDASIANSSGEFYAPINIFSDSQTATTPTPVNDSISGAVGAASYSSAANAMVNPEVNGSQSGVVDLSCSSSCPGGSLTSHSYADSDSRWSLTFTLDRAGTFTLNYSAISLLVNHAGTYIGLGYSVDGNIPVVFEDQYDFTSTVRSRVYSFPLVASHSYEVFLDDYAYVGSQSRQIGSDASTLTVNLSWQLNYSNITPTDLSFDSAGNLDYGYAITGADLPAPTTVDLYWASGTTPNTEIGDAIATTTTETAQGTYDLQEPASDFIDPPQGANYLIAVADPDNTISPADPSKVAAWHFAPVWTGLGSDNLWSDGLNWMGDIAPGDGASLVFPSGANQLGNQNDLDYTFDSILVSDNYTFSGNPINVNGDFSFRVGSTSLNTSTTVGGDTVIDNGAEVTVGAGTTLTDGAVVDPGAILNVNGKFDATANLNVSSNGTINVGVNGGITVEKDTAAYIAGQIDTAGYLDLNGQMNVAPSGSCTASAAVNIAATGGLDLQGGAQGGAQCTFTGGTNAYIQGLVKVGQAASWTGGVNSTTTFDGGTLSNSGTVTSGGGSLVFQDKAVYNADSGATTTFSGQDTITNGASVYDLGLTYVNQTLDIQGQYQGNGTCYVAAGAQVPIENGGNLSVQGKWNCNGVVSASGSYGSPSLNVTGDMTFSGKQADLSVKASGSLYEAKSGTLYFNAGATFNNQGKSLEAGAVYDFDAITVEPGAILDVGGTLTEGVGGQLTDDGTVIIEVGAVFNNQTASSITAGGALTIDGTATMTTGSSLDNHGTLTINPTGTLDIAGVVTNETGSTYLDQGTVKIEPGGSLILPSTSGTPVVQPQVTDVVVHYGSKSMSILNLKRDLPFSDITSIDILFSENVAAPGSAITLVGQGGAYGLSTSYNPTTFDETLKLSTALGIDRLTLALSNQIAAFSAPAATLNPFQLSFSVLPGDVNGDNSVDSLDLVAVRNGILGTLDQALIVWADIDGSGKIDINDYNIVKKFVGKRI